MAFGIDVRPLGSNDAARCGCYHASEVHANRGHPIHPGGAWPSCRPSSKYGCLETEIFVTPAVMSLCQQRVLTVEVPTQGDYLEDLPSAGKLVSKGHYEQVALDISIVAAFIEVGG